ncbi:MAG TPA: P-loop NTPase [Candidatus Megaira endosymbiont of Hartmannula sinica]|nr:P-loop NTPase [Candidatus Megaera endosymbiont of Hartmannula sinica]
MSQAGNSFNGNKHKIIKNDFGKVIFVTSGKGGVGKSTISSLIAQKLAHKGYKTAIADLDIYGPSINHIFGVNNMPIISDDNKMIPREKFKVKVNSLGIIIDKNKAAAYRGLMANKIINQILMHSF